MEERQAASSSAVRVAEPITFFLGFDRLTAQGEQKNTLVKHSNLRKNVCG